MFKKSLHSKGLLLNPMLIIYGHLGYDQEGICCFHVLHSSFFGCLMIETSGFCNLESPILTSLCLNKSSLYNQSY
jgi:hypothetical protein